MTLPCSQELQGLFPIVKGNGVATGWKGGSLLVLADGTLEYCTAGDSSTGGRGSTGDLRSFAVALMEPVADGMLLTLVEDLVTSLDGAPALRVTAEGVGRPMMRDEE